MFFNNTISYASQHMTTNSQLNNQLSIVAEFINLEGLKECSSAFSDNFYTFNQCLMDVINSGGHNMSEENTKKVFIITGSTIGAVCLLLFYATIGHNIILPAMRRQLHKCCPNYINQYSRSEIKAMEIRERMHAAQGISHSPLLRELCRKYNYARTNTSGNPLALAGPIGYVLGHGVLHNSVARADHYCGNHFAEISEI